LDEAVTDANKVGRALEQIGRLGYGRDASTGLGRFAVAASEEIPWPEWASAHALYTLGPAVLDQNDYDRVYCKPFVRFGRHGDRLAHSGNPFKNPVIMADEAAVCIAAKPLENFPGYVGKAVNGISKALPATVSQGYSICLPITGSRLFT
jgi:CRISPR-associated protein Csm4